MIEFQNFKWRKTKEEDLDFVMKLEEDEYPYVLKWKEYKHREALENLNINHLILMEKDKKIGYSILTGFNEGNDNIEIKRIVIKEKNRGIGRKSLKALIRYLFENIEAHRVWLDYHEFNEVGAYLYESMGFKKEGTLRESLKFKNRYYDVVVLSILQKEYIEDLNF
ncbi:MAG: GNAT family protein [Eubacteriales bacterium]